VKRKDNATISMDVFSRCGITLLIARCLYAGLLLAVETLLCPPKWHVKVLMGRAKIHKYFHFCNDSIYSTWVTISTTKADCLAKASICFEQPSTGLLAQRPRDASQIPIDYTFKTHDECVACNGVPDSFYSWRPNFYWAPRQYSSFQWKKREMIPGNYWIRAPSPLYFVDIVQAAVGKRFAKILESEQLCRYVTFSFLLILWHFDTWRCCDKYWQYNRTSMISHSRCDNYIHVINLFVDFSDTHKSKLLCKV